MKVVGERAMGPYLEPLDKIKQDKVRNLSVLKSVEIQHLQRPEIYLL